MDENTRAARENRSDGRKLRDIGGKRESGSKGNKKRRTRSTQEIAC